MQKKKNEMKWKKSSDIIFTDVKFDVLRVYDNDDYI